MVSDSGVRLCRASCVRISVSRFRSGSSGLAFVSAFVFLVSPVHFRTTTYIYIRYVCVCDWIPTSRSFFQTIVHAAVFAFVYSVLAYIFSASSIPGNLFFFYFSFYCIIA